MKNPVYKIQIDDITIRCGEKSDALAKKEAIDASLEHLHEFMPWSHNEPETIQQKEDRLVQWKQDFLEDKDYSVVVYRGEKLIACAGLHNRLNRNALEIGYWVRADEINKGVASKVSLALTIMALRFIKVDEVEIRHDIRNVASSKIPQKLKYLRKEDFIAEDKTKNAKWIIDQDLFNKNTDYYSSFYEKISFLCQQNVKVSKG